MAALTDIEIRIAKMIAESADNYGFGFEISIDGLTVGIEGGAEIDSYVEDDYYGGTGATVITDARITITEICAYSEDPDDENVYEAPHFDEEAVADYAERLLVA